MSEQEGSSIRAATGVVKWFDSRKGFGFIIGPSGQDVLAHFSNIEGNGFRILKDGWTVVYDACQTPKGWKATRIVLPPETEEQRQPALLSPQLPPSDSTHKNPEIVVVQKSPAGKEGSPADESSGR